MFNELEANLCDADESDAKAFRRLLHEAEIGLEYAYFDLAECYENGLGCERSDELAATWYRRAAEVGFPEAAFKIAGYCLGIVKDEHAAMRWYLEAANQGFLAAYAAVAACFRGQNDEEYFYWTEKAARQGDTSAYHPLGECYQNGIGCDVNKKLAAEHFLRAAEAGYEPAYRDLAKCYQDGYGVTKNDELAAFWFDKVRKSGFDVDGELLLD